MPSRLDILDRLRADAERPETRGERAILEAFCTRWLTQREAGRADALWWALLVTGEPHAAIVERWLLARMCETSPGYFPDALRAPAVPDDGRVQ